MFLVDGESELAWFPVGDGVRWGRAWLLALEDEDSGDDEGIFLCAEISGNGRIIDLTD